MMILDSGLLFWATLYNDFNIQVDFEQLLFTAQTVEVHI